MPERVIIAADCLPEEFLPILLTTGHVLSLSLCDYYYRHMFRRQTVSAGLMICDI